VEDPVLWYRQLHPDDRERWNKHFAPTCAASRPFRAVYRFLAKDGRVVWVHGSANLIRDAEGKPQFLQGVAFDITALKEAEEERERFFSLALDLFCVAGLDGYYKRVNHAFTRTLGYSEQELLGRPLIDFVYPDDREATLAELRKLAGGTQTIDFENRCRRKDGSYRWLQWSAAPFLPRQVVFAAARDVTQQKQDEESLRQMNAELDGRVKERTEALARSMAELREKTEELEKFAWVASHDLREPLRTLVNWPQKLAEKHAGQLDAESAKWLNLTIGGAERMRRLIENLSHYSRALRRDRALAPVDCAAAAQDALHNLEASIEESGAEVVVGELPVITGNAEQLMLLFQNLIGNAIKFRDLSRPIRVEVRAEEQEGSWLFRVADNGIGMKANHLPKIFEPGEKLHPRSKYPGTGFGLAICQKIVVGHGGRIWATSEIGQGSTFWFTFPKVPHVHSAALPGPEPE
jgi:PAS domain S-box-containing protein